MKSLFDKAWGLLTSKQAILIYALILLVLIIVIILVIMSNEQKRAYQLKVADVRNDDEKKSNNNGDRTQTLNDLFNNGEYIFNIPVAIKTNDEDILTMIVGKVNDHIITKDNRIIKLEDIVSIRVN